MANFKLGQRVHITHETAPFFGLIERIEKFKNPTATEYIVRAEDDNKLYRIQDLTTISAAKNQTITAPEGA